MSWPQDVGPDFRYALRSLRQKPEFAAVAVLTLAAGIGASTAIFGAVNPVLFEPLPYPHANRILTIWDMRTDGTGAFPAFGTFHELEERNRAFEWLAVMKPWQPTMTSAGQPERFEGQQVSADYFRTLGVRPALGRDFQASDDRPNAPAVVILSDAVWRRRFNADRSIAGRQIRLDEYPCTVIGVMPRSFENVSAASADVWSPLQYDMTQSRAWGHHLRMVGRLRPGLGTGQARLAVNEIAHTPVPQYPRAPWASSKDGFLVRTLQEEVTQAVRPALLVILGAALLVLAIACVNVTNLLLARGSQRRGEFAMRAALGAGRARMMRQLLTESLVLAAAGGLLGLVVAEFVLRGLIALSPPGLPRVEAIRLDGTVFAFGMGLTTTIGLIVGLAPAMQASRRSLQAGIQLSSGRTAGSHQLMRSALVVVEVALALVLLVSGGLLLRSMQRLFAVAPGFDARGVLTMQVQASGHRFRKDDVTHLFFSQALEAVRRVPGVTAAAFTSQLPLSGDFDVYGMHVEQHQGGRPDGADVFRYAVSPGYFETMAIPLRAGRLLEERDSAGAPPAVVIDESLAKHKFPGQDPIGQRILFGPLVFTIVGVVGDVKQVSLAVTQSDAVYVTAPQWTTFADKAMSLVVRVNGDAAPAIRNAIWSVDKDQPIVRLATMDSLLAASAGARRFALILFQAFGLVALLLAATGIYGVLSGSVTERMREMGVRSAMGASRGDLVGLVVGRGMSLAALGAAIGLAGSAAASKALVTLLFGISRLDLFTYLGVTMMLAVVSAIACGVPAWRAARVDPASALRAE